MVRAIDLRTPEPNDRPVRRRGVAIAGRGLPRCRSWLLDGIRLPERILLSFSARYFVAGPIGCGHSSGSREPAFGDLIRERI